MLRLVYFRLPVDEQQESEASPSASDRKKANTRFLGRYLKGVEQGNKRAIARNAAKGAQQHLAAAGAALLRPALHKSAALGMDAVSKVALKNAEQQKLVLCTSLLREVSVMGHLACVS